MLEITRLAKTGGPLTKRIFLNPEGKLISDGSACVMSRGRAQRVRLGALDQFAELVQQLEPNEAIALGALRSDLPDHVEVTTQDNLAKLNGSAPPDLIARNSGHISYEAGRPALALIDIDTKGMPDAVKDRIKKAGGFWAALASVLPTLASTSRIERRSTSTGISRIDTGEALPGSNGMHVFLHVQDGGDVERFLRAFHERCWLGGFGWHMVGAGGQLLDRSLVDRMVFAPERLVFEGAPVLVAPLAQDQASRRARVHDGAVLNTREACPPLRITETAQLGEIKSKSAHTLAPARASERERFIATRSEQLAGTAGITRPEARRVIERQCAGILLPDLALPWDSEDFAGCTVAHVLADPARFVGATMADPMEGAEYGRTKAMVMRRADGTPWINSFAHGRTSYELRYDARAATAAIAAAPNDQAADSFVRLAVSADLDADEMETLRNQASTKAGVGKRALDNKLKSAQKEHTARAKQDAKDRHAAERRDPRPRLPVPKPDAPYLPQMEALNDVLGGCDLPEPPMRDIEGFMTCVQVKRIPGMHLLRSDTANCAADKGSELGDSSEQPLLHRMDEISLAEMIETFIDYTDEDGRSVHLGSSFVKHFHQRSDGVLPVVVSVATLPVVTMDGGIMARNGLHRPSGTVFRIPHEILACVPSRDECTPTAAKQALNFLINEWLVDVQTDQAGRCALVSAAATIIQRIMLPARPAFMLSAAKRGGGKTTTLQMLGLAATGIDPSAASWSDNTEERRKALMSYFVSGVPLIIWDNIELGTEIYCPHIEKSITSPTVCDRILGETRQEVVPSTAIHMFTGNNILPVRDMASRTLHTRLAVDRPDPENRPFHHKDPIEWTRQNRGKILRALYTVMLAQPKVSVTGKGNGRFKVWWQVVGRPIENAAKDLGIPLEFGKMFLENEGEDVSVANLVSALEAMEEQWPAGFYASDVATLLNDDSNQKSNEAKDRAATLRDFLIPSEKAGREVSSKSIGRLLRKHVGTPVLGNAGSILKLDVEADRLNTMTYRIRKTEKI